MLNAGKVGKPVLTARKVGLSVLNARKVGSGAKRGKSRETSGKGGKLTIAFAPDRLTNSLCSDRSQNIAYGAIIQFKRVEFSNENSPAASLVFFVPRIPDKTLVVR